MDEPNRAVRKKVMITAYVSPYIKQIIQNAVESGDFASESDFVSHAVSWFAKEWVEEKKGKKVKLK